MNKSIVLASNRQLYIPKNGINHSIFSNNNLSSYFLSSVCYGTDILRDKRELLMNKEKMNKILLKI